MPESMQSPQQFLQEYFNDVTSSLSLVDFETFGAIVATLYQAYLHDNQVFILGNGGSAATAMHFACDPGA